MIGIRLKKLRAEKNLTQRQLGNLSEVSYVQIAKYEKDKANPSPKVVKKLASALDVSIDYFLDFNPETDVVFDQKGFDKKLEKIKDLSTPTKMLIEGFIDKCLKADLFESALKVYSNGNG